MSGPGFPSGPLHPYGYENRDFPAMPNPGEGQFHDQAGFAPPPGPPPSFPSHSPGFPDVKGEPPAFPDHPPAFPDAPHDNITERGFFSGSSHNQHPAPPPVSPPAPAQAPVAPPPSGFRVPLTSSAEFPTAQAGPPVAFDIDGRSPIYLGSALFSGSVHPCKIAPALRPPCRVPYAGTEYGHDGRFDLLPFDPATMEWVVTSQGRVPPGRRPVEGGYEEHGGKLYHALAQVSGVEVPGKTGEHLGGCNVAFGGGEHIFRDNYKILCWK